MALSDHKHWFTFSCVIGAMFSSSISTPSSLLRLLPTPTKLPSIPRFCFPTPVSIPNSNSNYDSSPHPTPPASPLPFSELRPIQRREASLALAALLSSHLLGFAASPASAEAPPAECQLTVAPSGLAFCDRVVGSGDEATKGQLIKAHYVGRLENGKVFDSSYQRGKPLTFRVGVGEVIKGWDQGILGGDGIPAMLAGGKRTLKLPPELGYGMRGAGCRGGSCIIPPDSTLLFDVEFIGKA
ncbi:peptidyl-prolyl cis-trans isomerase FKBP13, chloroplastic-like [Typha angustifolia]|uniref:peptidyl-prolyl cis-trans isomerase FKBP13, chloroplastic-like n=1 Tax=Typha angustifolia TaxID=59011 RepID=UPI003C2F4613